MDKKVQAFGVTATIAILICALACACAFLSTGQAQADDSTLTRHALPTSEPGLVSDPSKLTGENWMSGISGSLYLHEINIPGTHDSAMWDPYSQHVIAKTQYGYARTQSDSMDIKSQLKAGVRLFDLRLTSVYHSVWKMGMFGDEDRRTKGTQGLFLVHGGMLGWKGDWRFYCDQDKGVLTFETLLGWYATFLREHPTETLILDVSYESNSGDQAVTLARAREKLEKYYTEKNPSTGKPYIYTENGNKTVTTMPQLSDCRGQMVIMSSDKLERGITYGWQSDWGSKTIGGVHFANENHYEATKDKKSDYVKSMLFGGTVDGAKFSDPVGGASTKLQTSVVDAPKKWGIVACTSANRPVGATDSPHQNPSEIADVVNKKMYGDAGILKEVGRHYGWIMSDFVTKESVASFWKTNFPKDLQYATVAYEVSAQSGYSDKVEKTVLSGSQITLPSNPFTKSSAKEAFDKSYKIVGWTIDGKEYNAGDTVTITGNTTVKARISMTWYGLQALIDAAASSKDGKPINLECDVVGVPTDRSLCVPENADITIKMNGYTINRDSKASGYSRVFDVDGKLTLDGSNGSGTITGGYAENGGGILVRGTLVTKDVKILNNRASVKGGGVYVIQQSSFTMEGGSISNNIAVDGGGVHIGALAKFAMKDGSISGNNGTNGGGVSAVRPGSDFSVSGNVSVQGNYLLPSNTQVSVNTALKTDGDKQNVLLSLRNTITLDGNLNEGARIGVTKAADGTVENLRVSSGLDGKGALKNFESDQANRTIVLLDKEAALSSNIIVSFDADGGAPTPSSQTIGKGSTATQPSEQPTKSKYVFEYWYKADDPTKAQFDFSKTIDDNIILKAKWKPAAQTVTFHTGEGASTIEPQKVDFGSKATQPANPTREGSTFSSWYIRVPIPGYYGQTVAQPYDFSNPVLKDIDLYARWTTDTHTVSFEVDGGSAVAQQTVIYGQTATQPEDPKKDGYSFGGWYTDKELTRAYSFTTPVKTNVTLYAKWVSTRYSVTFVTNGGTEAAAQSVEAGGKAIEPNDPTRSDCTFTGWFLSSAFAGSTYDFNTPVTGDAVLHAQWDITVTFDSNGGSSVSSQKVATGAQAVRPESDPTREGYVFAGWYAGANLYDFETPVDAPLALTAHWAKKPAETYLVVFDSNGGSAVEMQEVAKGGNAVAPTTPTKANCTFSGWYSDSDLTQQYDFSAAVNEDIFLYAKWSVDNHTVTFDALGGSPVPGSQTVEHGKCAETPDEPAKEGCLFAGWYKNKDCTVPFSFSNPVVADITLYAKWVPMRYDVVFVSNGGTEVAAQSVEAGGKASNPTPTRTGCDFAGWYTDDGLADKYDFSKEVTADIILYAKWTAKVEFKPDNGTTIASKTAVCGEGVDELDEPKKDNCVFEGWFVESDASYTSEEIEELENEVATDSDLADYVWIVDGKVRVAYDFDEPVNSGTTLYARWAPEKHTVTFDTQGGTPAIDPLSVEDGKQVSEPSSPTKEWCTFDGWYYDAACTLPFDFSASVYSDLTLHAKWADVKHYVQFVSDWGDDVPYQLVAHGQKATKPSDPACEGYEFAGWYADVELETEFNFGDLIEADTYVYAKWTEAQQPAEYTVTFVDEDPAEGEELPSPQTVTAGTSASKPQDPVREYATFAGWFIELDTELTDEEIAVIEDDPEQNAIVWIVNKKPRVLYGFDELVEGDITLYARWNYEDCLVTYVDQGSELFVDAVQKGSLAENIQFDEVDGYKFEGWCSDEGLTKLYDFSQPVTQDMTLYSMWMQDDCTLTFQSNGGSEVEAQEVSYGEKAAVPEDPVWAGHTFMGWYSDSGKKLTDEQIAMIEEAEQQYGFEYTDLLWQTDETTMVKCDLESEPLYGDLELQARWEEGAFTCEVVIEDGAPQVEILNLKEAARSVLSDDELAQGAHVKFVVSPLSDTDVTSEDAKALDENVKKLGASHGVTFDISVYKSIDGSAEETAVHELPVAAKLSVSVPDSLIADNRVYYFLRAHEGESALLGEGSQGKVEGSSDRFSTYELATKDEVADSTPDKAKTSAKGTSSATPKTGDMNFAMIALVLSAAVIALVGIALLATRLKKSR